MRGGRGGEEERRGVGENMNSFGNTLHNFWEYKETNVIIYIPS